MRLHRFFFLEENLKGLSAQAGRSSVRVLSADLLHQWKNVFRFKAGDKLILLDNSGMEYLSEITLLSKEVAELVVLESSLSKNMPTKEIWLFAALIKKDNFEWILEKCTEIGVSHFVPIISDRSEKKNLNMERAQKIVKEASEQSGRGVMPVLHEIMKLEDVFNLGVELPSLIALHTTAQTRLTPGPSPYQERGNPPKADGERTMGIFIGPEGGWSEREIELFKSKNIPLCSLGTQILRAETAAVAASVLLLL